MDFTVDTAAADMLQTLNRQRRDDAFCDVTLSVDQDLIPAHRCVLAASSEYFRTLFLSNFDDRCSETYNLPSVNTKAVKQTIDFIYSGHIRISLQNVDEILKAADLLGVKEVKKFCSDFLIRHLDLSNCIYIKSLTDQFSLDDIRTDVINFLVPLMVDLYRGSDMMDIPFEYVYPLVSDPQLNFIKETELLNFMVRWIQYNLDERKSYFQKLIPLTTFSYIPPSYIRRNVYSSKPVMDALNPNQRNVVEVKLSQEAYPDRTEDVLFCLSRRSRPEEEIRLVIYRILEDQWITLQNAPEAGMFEHLESLTSHQGSLYLLLMYPPANEVNGNTGARIWKLELDRGRWCQMPSPAQLTGKSRLVSHNSGLYVIDRNGIIEKFNNMTEAWVNYSEASFDENPDSTLYILPMPMDRYIYLLRGFTQEHQDNSGQHFCIQVHRYDTNKYSWDALYRIEPKEHDIEEYEQFYGYTATPYTLILKNPLGLPRINYDFQKRKCTINIPQTSTPIFVRDIVGSVEYQKRVYFAGQVDNRRPVFMFYDLDQDRFKYVRQPPCHLSGLLCHVVAPRSINKTLTRDKTEEGLKINEVES